MEISDVAKNPLTYLVLAGSTFLVGACNFLYGDAPVEKFAFQIPQSKTERRLSASEISDDMPRLPNVALENIVNGDLKDADVSKNRGNCDETKEEKAISYYAKFIGNSDLNSELYGDLPDLDFGDYMKTEKDYNDDGEVDCVILKDDQGRVIYESNFEEAVAGYKKFSTYHDNGKIKEEWTLFNSSSDDSGEPNCYREAYDKDGEIIYALKAKGGFNDRYIRRGDRTLAESWCEGEGDYPGYYNMKDKYVFDDGSDQTFVFSGRGIAPSRIEDTKKVKLDSGALSLDVTNVYNYRNKHLENVKIKGDGTSLCFYLDEFGIIKDVDGYGQIEGDFSEYVGLDYSIVSGDILGDINKHYENRTESEIEKIFY